jgi:hypothetical protein
MIAPPGAASTDSLQRQVDLLRFSEELQSVMARCNDEAAVSASAVHRCVSAFGAGAGCVALYDAVTGRFDLQSHTRGGPDWPVPLFARSLAEGHPAFAEGIVAFPFT